MEKQEVLNEVKGGLGLMQTALLSEAGRADENADAYYLLDDVCRGVRSIIKDLENDKAISQSSWWYIKIACERYNQSKD